jgi:hypothetical protein
MNDGQPELPFGGSDKTLSEAEALALMDTNRKWLIAKGYDTAVELAIKFGYVYGQMILAEFDRTEAWTNAEQTIRTTWLGVVFRGKDYRDTWELVGYTKAGNKKRNAHAHAVAVWKLRGEPTPDFERLGLDVQLIDADTLSDADKRTALEALRRVWAAASSEDQRALTKLGRWLDRSIKKKGKAND